MSMRGASVAITDDLFGIADRAKSIDPRYRIEYNNKTRIERLAALQAEIDRHNALEEQRRLSELRSKAMDALDGIL